jgi:diamine N-acetyltransferase
MKKDTRNITYTQTGAEGLDKIAPLWLKLREHHKERAPVMFKEFLGNITYDSRKKSLIEKSVGGHLLVDIATDKVTGKAIGYCVSSLSAKKVGEIESIYVEQECRKQHIGDKFMKTALAWMDGLAAINKIIGVVEGNEEAFGFYEKYGFYPRAHILQQVDSK